MKKIIFISLFSICLITSISAKSVDVASVDGASDEPCVVVDCAGTEEDSSPVDYAKKIKLKNEIYDLEARFVSGQERERLLKEVKSKLAHQIEVKTVGWKVRFGENVRM